MNVPDFGRVCSLC